MTVWILYDCMDDETLGVYSTRVMAEKARMDFATKRNMVIADFWISEWVLDENY